LQALIIPNTLIANLAIAVAPRLAHVGAACPVADVVLEDWVWSRDAGYQGRQRHEDGEREDGVGSGKVHLGEG